MCMGTQILQPLEAITPMRLKVVDGTDFLGFMERLTGKCITK
jgi:hypothetical protein